MRHVLKSNLLMFLFTDSVFGFVIQRRFNNEGVKPTTRLCDETQSLLSVLFLLYHINLPMNFLLTEE